MKLPENLREELKIPLGILLHNKDVNKENISKYVKPDTFLITVGDATTEKMSNFGLIPSLQIIDKLEKRVKRNAPKENQINTNLTCANPAGQITQQSIDAIKQAFTSTLPVRITVNGEEDLLVIPVCINAPEGSVVMYGQPNEGLVIVNVDSKIRSKTQTLLESMN